MSDHPSCPYANRGLEPAGMSACPTFVAADLSVVLTVSGGQAPQMLSARGVYCGHLRLQESRRTFGFSSACAHPAGPPSVATIELTGRRRSRGVEPVTQAAPPD